MIEPARQGADVLIANYHAPREVDVSPIVATLARFGVRTIRLHEEVFKPAVFFRLMALAPFGALTHMPQFKAAPEDGRDAHLFTYPVLMTQDVMGYDEVLVGEDQGAHLEFARRLIRKYNKVYRDNFRVPAARVVGGRVMDLRHPDRKMSKSEPDGCLFLNDPPDAIRAKLRAAVADEAGLANLRSLYGRFVGGEIPAMNADLKLRLADAMIDAFR